MLKFYLKCIFNINNIFISVKHLNSKNAVYFFHFKSIYTCESCLAFEWSYSCFRAKILHQILIDNT